MKKHTIRFEQFIDLPVEDVFNFFSKPENLSLITPPRLRFKILTPTPVPMKKGQSIDYILTIMYLFKIRWTSLIQEYNRPYSFVDTQITGPYSYWHHTHSFISHKNGTIIKDCVVYSIPFGIVGTFLNAIYIKYDLNSIFKYRHKILDQIFTQITHQSKEKV